MANEQASTGSLPGGNDEELEAEQDVALAGSRAAGDDAADGALAPGDDAVEAPGDNDASADPAEALEDDVEEEAELDDEAAADAAAAEAEGVGASAAAAPTRASARTVTLHPQARDGLIRCLQARIAQLDATLAHATAAAQRDPFYIRWPNVVTELRAQALKRLEELQRS